MPLIKKCLICDKEFKTKLFFVKQGSGKYCSKACHYEGLRKGKIVECFKCGEKIYRSPKSLKSSKSGKFFCSKTCQTKWRNQIFIGEKHGNWKHGGKAYKSVLGRHNIQKKCKYCGVKDERILAVHHIDKDRTNNKVENLCWLCHNCHFLIHYHIKQDKKLLNKLKG